LRDAPPVPGGRLLPDPDESRPAKPKRLSRFPFFAGAVPVLLYHGLVDRDDGYSVAPAAFDAELQRLHELGFRAVALDRYVALMRGENVALPRRPILITFDDGRLSSWQNADQALARHGDSAVMCRPARWAAPGT
jgi:peptidoglycan/xylan/chitin deacetylase (PgdA/CDA1 family)